MREKERERDNDDEIVSAYYDWSRISFFSLNITAGEEREEQIDTSPDGALTALWQTQCFIIDISQGGGTVSGSLSPGVRPRAGNASLSLPLSLRDAHQSYSTRRAEGKREGKLRLTVNFVVSGWSEISEPRDWPSAPLEIRTHPSIANRRRSRDLRSAACCDA